MRVEKLNLTKEYVARLNASPFFIAVSFQGLNVGQLTELRKRLFKVGRREQIAPDKTPPSDRFGVPGRQVVEHGDVVTILGQHLAHVRADISGPTADEDVHCAAIA